MSMKFTLATLIAGVVLLGSHAAFAAGDAAAGEKVFRKCKACHSVEAGKNKVGPTLHGVFGRSAGAVEDFKYSDAMTESGIVWDEETMDTYLANPKKMVPGTRMAFPGLKKEEDRVNVITYLQEATQ